MRSRLLLLGGQAIALGLMMAFLVVPASSLFLVAYGADALPFVYLAVAAVGVAVSWSMSRAQRRWSLSRQALTLLASFAALVSTGWLLLVAVDAPWVTFPLLVMFPLSIPLGFVIIGAQAGRLLDLQQMKAHFPRVVAGFSVGFAIGGLLAAWLARVTGDVVQLLGFDVLATGLFIGLVVEAGRRYPAQLRNRPETSAVTSLAVASKRSRIWRIRLVRLVFGYQLLSAAVTQLLDFMVWERAAFRYPDATDLAAFLGVFGAIINVVSVAFVAVLAGRLLSRFGISLGLSANPVGVIALLSGCLLFGYIGGPATLIFFVLVCAAQVTDIALTDGTTRTSINATYQALRPVERLRAQSFVEAAGVPLALGFVGALLLLLDALDLDVLTVAAGTAALSVAWLILAVLTYKEYGRNLRSAFARRDWDPTALQVDDDASRVVLEKLLGSDDIRDVRLGLDVLTAADPPRLPAQAARLLHDPDDDRKILGLETAARLGDPALRRDVLDVVDDRAVPPSLRALSVRVAAELGADAHDLMASLSDPDPRVRFAAAAAAALSLDGAGQGARNLCVEALIGQDTAALDAALAAVARAPQPEYAEAILVLARQPTAPDGLADALAAHVRYLSLDLRTLLALAADSPQAAGRTVDALGQNRHDSSFALLVELALAGNRDLAAAAGRALAASGFSLDATAAKELTAAETARAIRAATGAQALADLGTAEHLVSALDDAIADCAQRVRVTLGMAFGTVWLERAIDQLGSPVDGERGLAIETLEVELGHQRLPVVLALFDPTLDVQQRRERLAHIHTTTASDANRWLTEILDDPADFWQDPWLLACALHATPQLEPAQAVERGRQHQNHPDPVVSETALWLLAGGRLP